MTYNLSHAVLYIHICMHSHNDMYQYNALVDYSFDPQAQLTSSAHIAAISVSSLCMYNIQFSLAHCVHMYTIAQLCTHAVV